MHMQWENFHIICRLNGATNIKHAKYLSFYIFNICNAANFICVEVHAWKFPPTKYLSMIFNPYLFLASGECLWQMEMATLESKV